MTGRCSFNNISKTGGIILRRFVEDSLDRAARLFHRHKGRLFHPAAPTLAAHDPTARRYIFNHIPKTGGLSLHRLLSRSLGSAHISPHFALDEDLDYAVNAADYEKYLVIFGHIGVVWNDVIGPDRRWMTMLRDPVDRVLSEYYFWRNAVPPSPNLQHIQAAKTLSLREFVSWRGTDNTQTWFLADDFPAPRRKVPPDAALDTAQRNLAERFDFIGIFEEFDESVRRLSSLLGLLYRPRRVPFENRTPRRKSAGEIDPETIAAIREQNSLDCALYEYAVALNRTRAEEAQSRQSAVLP